MGTFTGCISFPEDSLESVTLRTSLLGDLTESECDSSARGEESESHLTDSALAVKQQYLMFVVIRKLQSRVHTRPIKAVAAKLLRFIA